MANTALLLGMLLVARLMGDAGQAQAVRPAMWLLVFAPGAAAFGMAYSDSLLLAASAGALLAVRRDRTWVGALLLSVATLARPPGILLVVPLAVAIFQRQGRITWHLAALATGPVCLALFAAYQGAVLGDPLAFLHAQAAWTLPSITQGGSGIAAPSVGVITVAALLILTLLGYTALLLRFLRSRLPWPEKLMGLVAYASVFLSGRLQSDARYLGAGWPFAWFIGLWRRPWLQVAFGLSLCWLRGLRVAWVLATAATLEPLTVGTRLTDHIRGGGRSRSRLVGAEGRRARCLSERNHPGPPWVRIEGTGNSPRSTVDTGRAACHS